MQVAEEQKPVARIKYTVTLTLSPLSAWAMREHAKLGTIIGSHFDHVLGVVESPYRKDERMVTIRGSVTYRAGEAVLRGVARSLFTMLEEAYGEMDLRALLRFETPEGLILGYDSDVVY